MWRGNSKNNFEQPYMPDHAKRKMLAFFMKTSVLRMLEELKKEKIKRINYSITEQVLLMSNNNDFGLYLNRIRTEKGLSLRKVDF